MKRVLVLSDSHGNVNNMILAVRLGGCRTAAEKMSGDSA